MTNRDRGTGAAVPNPFEGRSLGGRFELLRKIGEGGMGVVYHAYDRERADSVAAKTMHRADPKTVYRFKQEFRALADIAHPNLVTLHELLNLDDLWLFTMEFIDGPDFIRYVRSGHQAPPTSATFLASTSDSTLESPGFESTPVVVPSSSAAAFVGRVTLDPPALARLRVSLRQLVEGLEALHAAGHLHRDVKPSNVLTTRTGRVVLLDFGLVAPLRSTSALEPATQEFAGTPMYMSPEQLAGRPLSAASDWYNVGVMLYEALTGQLPFAETRDLAWLRALKDRSELPVVDAPDADTAELVRLAQDLLAPEPARRPSGADILRRLGGPLAPIRPVARPTSSPALVGRDKPLADLHAALGEVAPGQPVVAIVRGPSGIGKTALVHAFLERVRASKDMLVLEGRCYERESVPFKALDSIIDRLGHFLAELDAVRAADLLPRHASALLRLFPALGMVERFRTVPARTQEVSDPQELRARGFRAFKELLARVTDRISLVLFVDDLQWGDADSAALFAEILSPPDAPALLLIASHRGDSERAARALAPAGGEPRTPPRTHDILLDPLDREDSCALALELLGGQRPPRRALAEAIAHEAAGSPFLLQEFARHVRDTGLAQTPEAEGVTLERALSARIARLPSHAQRLLQTVAAAGRPLPAALALGASGIERTDAEMVALLRAGHLLRVQSTAGRDSLEASHDRIRELVVAALTPEEVARTCRRLAETAEAEGAGDPEELAEYWRAASEPERAGGYAVQAAEQAMQALAFDRAARLFRLAADLQPTEPGAWSNLQARLGDALANAGRSAEAARSYLLAAKETDPRRRLQLQRRAAEQLLVSGHIEEGLSVIGRVLAAANMALAPTPRRALLSLLWRRVRLALRGLRFEERPLSDVPEGELLIIDICWAVAVGLGIVDTIRAADFQTRHLLLALRAGEPYRIAKALAVEAGFRATRGSAAIGGTLRISDAASALAEKIGHPHAIALARLTAGMTYYMAGRWRPAFELCERAHALLAEQCTGVAWELTSARRFALSSLEYLGELRELRRRVVLELNTAVERGNRYAATDLRCRLNVAWLAADDPEEASRQVAIASAQWSQAGFHLQHYNMLRARAQVALYLGDANEAFRGIEEGWSALAKSLLLRIQIVRIEALYLRGRAAIAAAALDGDDRKRRLAAQLERRLLAEPAAWARPLAFLLRAAREHQAGRREQAIEVLERAAAGFEQEQMAAHAAATRRRLGQLKGAAAGAAAVEAADAWSATQQVKAPQRYAVMIAPGFD